MQCSADKGAPEGSITVTDITPDYWCELQPTQPGRCAHAQLPARPASVSSSACLHAYSLCNIKVQAGSQTPAARREFGKRLFMDGPRLERRGDDSGVEALFGSFTDPAFVSDNPPVGPLGRLAGRVSVAWAGAVLHVLSKEDVRAFAAHAHLVLAPGGAWIGVRAGSICRGTPWVAYVRRAAPNKRFPAVSW